MSRRHVSSIALVLAVTAGLARLDGQTPAAKAAPAAEAAAAPDRPAPPAAPTPAANFAYGAEGRRDPFVPLVGGKGPQRGVTQMDVRPEGLPGMKADEMSVRGIIQSKGSWVAMVSGPSGKVYTVRTGDRLADGTVRSITAEAVIILQQVNDPLSLEKQREVRKFLRGGETK